MNDAAYRNRIFEFVKRRSGSETNATSVKAALGGVVSRFDALDSLANKGVHANLAVREAEICAINTYIIAGELLALNVEPETEV